MTNEMIIMVETQKLAKEGKLKYTGRTFKALNAGGEEVDVPEVEPIHTVNGWNERGYYIKPGHHSNIKFPIWFWGKNKKRADVSEEEAHERGDCYMRTASWFTFDQVETEEERKARKATKNN